MQSRYCCWSGDHTLRTFCSRAGSWGLIRTQRRCPKTGNGRVASLLEFSSESLRILKAAPAETPPMLSREVGGGSCWRAGMGPHLWAWKLGYLIVNWLGRGHVSGQALFGWSHSSAVHLLWDHSQASRPHFHSSLISKMWTSGVPDVSRVAGGQNGVMYT